MQKNIKTQRYTTVLKQNKQTRILQIDKLHGRKRVNKTAGSSDRETNNEKDRWQTVMEKLKIFKKTKSGSLETMKATVEVFFSSSYAVGSL